MKLSNKLKSVLLAVLLFIPQTGRADLFGIGDATMSSELAAILESVREFKASSGLEFLEEIGKEIEQIDQLLVIGQNTYNSVEGIIHADNVIDAVYSGARLLGDNELIAPIQAFTNLSKGCNDLLCMYRTYLGACQYFSSIDRNFDVNGACNTLHYMSDIMQDSIQNVSDLITIIGGGSDALAAKEAMEEHYKKLEEQQAKIQRRTMEMATEELNKMRYEAAVNGLTPYPLAYQVRTMGADGGLETKRIPRSGSALKSDRVTSGNTKTGDSSVDNTVDSPFYDYGTEAESSFKEAIPLVLDIATIITFILAIIFSARNYARKHSGEHGSDNALFKTAVGAFIIIAIIQIVRAIFVSL